MTHWPKNGNYRTPHVPDPIHLPEGYHSFGHVSTSIWKRSTALLCRNDIVCVSWCITKQSSKTMINLAHSVFPTILVTSSSVVALYIPCFLKWHKREKGDWLYIPGGRMQSSVSQSTHEMHLSNTWERSSHQINPLVELPSFFIVPTLLSGWDC